MRLRQLIALKQNSHKQLDGKEQKMMQKLKPYLNRFRITTTENGLRNVNRVRYISNFLFR